ncbi:MAG TPA: MFS transporter [Jatrophihabitans sp.]|nr:MFS transporter [Jatrophihabitans sp.]
MAAPGSSSNRVLVLTAMIFAVAMTFIDQTIVSVAAPRIQSELGLSDTGLQWAINAYLLALAALFAFGGRLADIAGHRRMVVLGVVIFAAASVLCGLTPNNGLAEGWLIAFRAVQGAGGALMYPAALAIVVETFPIAERGRALAMFFGLAGGLTAVGPALGGFLVLWTWRAIFWVNVPVALVALLLIGRARPSDVRHPARLDYRGLILVVLGVGLSVFGFQQSAQLGWTNPVTGLSIALGAALLVAFVRVELRTEQPLMEVRIFRDRAFAVENLVLLVAMIAFVPVFFFASEYAQISLAESASMASLTLLYFFLGFAFAAQIGGRMLDRGGAKRPVLLGSAVGTVGFGLWAARVTDLSIGQQVWCIVLAGAGMGLMLGQANTDALNRAPSTAYGEATGITQTVRNYGASLGLAVLGTVLITRFRTDITASLIDRGVPSGQAHRMAASLLSQPHGTTSAIPQFVRADFAHATQLVLYGMAAAMALAGVVALIGLRRGTPARAGEPATNEPVPAEPS